MLTASPDGKYYGVTPTKVDSTNNTNDPKRIPLLWGAGPAVAITAQPGKYIFKNNADHLIMNYSELQFMKAEAAFIKGDKACLLYTSRCV